MIRKIHHSEYSSAWLCAQPTSVSVVVPTRLCEATIGGVVGTLAGLRERGAIDEVIVVDAGGDRTAEIAKGLGADVYDENALLPELGPALGKGDAMWRALSVCRGDVVCFVDGDTQGFAEHFAVGTVGPVVEGRACFAKACFQRPFTTPAGDVLPAGGGRVTELMARPLLRTFWPELAALRQPLAGEMAATRELLAAMPFAVGYAIETGLLLDVHEAVGAERIIEVDLDVRLNAHQSLTALSSMADEVLGAALARVPGGQAMRQGRLLPLERPPLAELLPPDAQTSVQALG